MNNIPLKTFIIGVLNRAKLPKNFIIVYSMSDCNYYLSKAIHDNNKNDYNLPHLFACINLGKNISFNFKEISPKNLYNKTRECQAVCEENSYCGFNIGETHLPFAFIDVCGRIIFFELVCNQFMTQHKNLFGKSIRSISEFAKNSALRYNLMNDNKKSILDLDLNEIRQDLLLSLINQGFSDPKNQIDKSNLDNFLRETLDKVIFNDSKSNSLFKFVLMNDLYRTKIAEHVERIDKVRENAFRLGMINGSTFVSALENKGYRTIPFRQLFIKKVNIIPQFCIIDNEKFKWCEGEQNIYRIEAIEFNLTELLHGEEAGIIAHNIGDRPHPNTNPDNNLCLGDLYYELKDILKSDTSNIEDFERFIDLTESTLNVVNFDSSYQEINVDWDEENLSDFLIEVGDFTNSKVKDENSFVKL